MPKEFLPLEGGCRCGGVRFRVEAPPLLTMACHCTGCQRMTASAFSLSALIPSAAFVITKGEPVVGGLRASPRHYFCSYCMSWIFTRIDGFDTLLSLRVTMLDDPSWFVPFIETYTSEKLPWATTPAVYRFEKFPDPESYAGLAKEFQEQFNTRLPGNG
ncbi:MAG TPA: GFA family protein [Gammaproteobacteria bacterium]|nr:GFA family protein [Gammaproteobacteria bacterium]